MESTGDTGITGTDSMCIFCDKNQNADKPNHQRYECIDEIAVVEEQVQEIMISQNIATWGQILRCD